MKITALCISPKSDPGSAGRQVFEFETQRELRVQLGPLMPVCLAITPESLELLKRMPSLFEERGVKNDAKPLSKLLLGREKYPILECNFTDPGQALRSLNTLVRNAGARSERNAYFIVVHQTMLDRMADKASARGSGGRRGDGGKSAARVAGASAAVRFLSGLFPPEEKTDKLAGTYQGNSPEVKLVRQLIRKAAAHRNPVLILGESGTGKEVAAKAIHGFGLNKKRPFVTVNCGAISPNLFESELFGHEKGVFTGADSMKKGLWETAEDGTLFLDEIGDLIPDHQVKILRAIANREFFRVGGLQPIRSSARVIAATNRDLYGMMRSGQFREDLFYRLRSSLIFTPPLRQIPDDIRGFVQSIWTQLTKSHPTALPPGVVNGLVRYSWPGNVRELKSVLRNLHDWFGVDSIRPDHLRAVLQFETAPTQWKETGRGEWLRLLMRIEEILAAADRAMEPLASGRGCAPDFENAALQALIDVGSVLVTAQPFFRDKRILFAGIENLYAGLKAVCGRPPVPALAGPAQKVRDLVRRTQRAIVQEMNRAVKSR
jgi:hypothetical protein